MESRLKVLELEAEIRDTVGVQQILYDDPYFCFNLYQRASNWWTFETESVDEIEEMEEAIRASLFKTGLKYSLRRLNN